MAWGAELAQRIPPLASWTFYLVNCETPRDFNATAFKFNLEYGKDLYSGAGPRYNFFFLPGATPEQCIAHYRGEIAARGTRWRQVRQVRMAIKEMKEEEDEGADNSAQESSSDEDEDEDETQPGITNEHGLPGLPWPKHENDWLFTNYRQCLFMYLDPSSDIQSSRNVCLVKFDPMPIKWEEGARVRWDPKEQPICTKYMKLIDEGGGEEDLRDWIQDRRDARWVLEASGATEQAKTPGRKAW
ncbi:Ff.00g114680.m01.CDS01 [Fusarium sp. VM40]|nr:Ff.00g114680.m01.CDS01 [Fusarium sp. VM40]